MYKDLVAQSDRGKRPASIVMNLSSDIKVFCTYCCFALKVILSYGLVEYEPWPRTDWADVNEVSFGYGTYRSSQAVWGAKPIDRAVAFNVLFSSERFSLES